MNNELLEEIIKQKDYCFKNGLFKIIKEYDLTLNELLLLLYFDNQNAPVLNVPLIKAAIDMEEKEIYKAFSGLSSKGLISVKIVKDNNKSSEIIDLSNYYSSIVSNLNKKIKNDTKDGLYETFEKEFGRLLSPIEYEIISTWIKNGTSYELIIGALKEATYNGVSNLRYIDKIIYEWGKKGFKTMEDVNNHLKRNSEKKEEQIFFDYNWLDDEG